MAAETAVVDGKTRVREEGSRSIAFSPLSLEQQASKQGAVAAAELQRLPDLGGQRFDPFLLELSDGAS